MIVTRRKFLICLSGLIAAPAVVRVSSLMSVRAFTLEPVAYPYTVDFNVSGLVVGDRVRFYGLNEFGEWEQKA